MKTYRVSKSHVWTLGVGAAIFVLLPVGLSSVPMQSHEAPAAVGRFLTMIWSAFGGFCVLELSLFVACFRERLEVGERRVVLQGMFSRREFALAEVAEARWQEHGPFLKLVGANGQALAKIAFARYNLAERSELIRWFRTELPRDVQRGWPRFCWSQRPLKEDHWREPAADEFRVTRRRGDVIGAVCLVGAVIFGLAGWWMTDQPSLLWSPLTVVPFWLMLRYTTPRTGTIARRTQPVEWNFGVAIFGLMVVALGGILAWEKVFPGDDKSLAAIILVGVWTFASLALILYLMHRWEQSMRKRVQPQVEALAAQCDREWGVESNSTGEAGLNADRHS